MKRLIALLLSSLIILSFSGCIQKPIEYDYTPISGLDTKTKAEVKIAIPYETNKPLNEVANLFMEKYQNVDVQLQYVEDYDTNAVQLFKDNSIDIIFKRGVTYTEEYVEDEETGEKVLTGKTTEDYYYDFCTDTEIDFSETTPDLTDNYRYKRIDENGNEITYQYCYPLGGETRGVFVNKSLLDRYDLSIPSNYTELLECCEVLKQEGYIPIQGGVDAAAYGLGIAPAANSVVHDEAALAEMAAAVPGINERFKDTFSKIYELSANRYYDYKTVEESGWYVSTDDIGQAQSFLGLRTDEETFELTKPENNIGNVAFMPYISSLETFLNEYIREYSLDTEIEFICSPLNDVGTNSPVYITPYYGLCANKNSENLIWVREFINFIFKAENNKLYAEYASLIPNTTDALDVVVAKYGVDADKDIALCGQIRFSDTYNGYQPLANALKVTIKLSAQKYMVDLNRDENGNIQYYIDENGKEFLYMGNGETVVYKEYIGEEDTAKPGFAFCTLDYYMNVLEEEFAKYRVE